MTGEDSWEATLRSNPERRWKQGARENVERWGKQGIETVLLATQEELGELSQAVLEARDEDGDPERIRAELDDLAALMFQLQWEIDRRSDSE